MTVNNIDNFGGEIPQEENTFAHEVETMDCLSIFARSIPQWSANNDVSVNIIIKGDHDAVEFHLGLSENGTDEMAEDLLVKIRQNEELMKLTYLINEFKRVNVSEAEINRLIDRAEYLAKELHPE